VALRIAKSFVFKQSNPYRARRIRLLVPPALVVCVLALLLRLPSSAHIRALPLSKSAPRASAYFRGTSTNSAELLYLTLGPKHPRRRFALGAVGLSVEVDQLATRDLASKHNSLVQLMRRLGSGVLRLGGNSLDYSWWTSGSEDSPAWATSVITPADLANLRGLLVATGWKAVLGVDLGHFDPARAANEARTANRILGSRLLGFEIGNEPNDYGHSLVGLRPVSYSVGNYLEELSAYSAAMRAAAPKLRLYGPDLSSPAGPSSEAWLSAIASDRGTPFTAITQHYYPTSYSFARGNCKATPIPTALDLLSPEVREQENAALKALAQAGRDAHREIRITETNDTSSCDTGGGPETSPVFASALWSLDWVLRAASAGVTGINFHGNFGRCAPNAFSPMCAPNDVAAISGQVSARPEYYGLVAARELEGGRFIPTSIRGPGAVTAYATVHPDRIITLAIDDFATEGSTSVALRVPGYDVATGERLIGPSIGATGEVTFGEASSDAAGVLRPAAMPIPRVHGTFLLHLPPASAIVVTLHEPT
jgi:hypothetical protein